MQLIVGATWHRPLAPLSHLCPTVDNMHCTAACSPFTAAATFNCTTCYLLRHRPLLSQFECLILRHPGAILSNAQLQIILIFALYSQLLLLAWLSQLPPFVATVAVTIDRVVVKMCMSQLLYVSLVVRKKLSSAYQEIHNRLKFLL